MGSDLATRLGLSVSQEKKLEARVGRVKSVAEFLSGAAEAAKDLPVGEAIAKAAPWLGAVGGALTAALPIIKFLLELFKELTKQSDPNVLGHLACTMAYEQQVEQTIKAVGGPSRPEIAIERMQGAFDALAPGDEVDFRRMTFAIDAQLGDGLIRLCASVHTQVAIAEGWTPPEPDLEGPSPEEAWRGISKVGSGPRRCQCQVLQHRGKWVLFSPSGKSPVYFANYVARINGAGWRPLGPFPLGVNLGGVDLRGAQVTQNALKRKHPSAILIAPSKDPTLATEEPPSPDVVDEEH